MSMGQDIKRFFNLPEIQFYEHLFIRTPMEGCFCIASHISFSPSCQENACKKSATKGNSKAAGEWLQIYWKRTSLHALLRSSTNNISFLYTLLKFRSIYFQEHLWEANFVQKVCSYKHLVNASQRNSYYHELIEYRVN